MERIRLTNNHLPYFDTGIISQNLIGFLKIKLEVSGRAKILAQLCLARPAVFFYDSLSPPFPKR